MSCYTITISGSVQVNNAGCMVHERKVDELGFETNFATNTLAVHILTSTLLPLIQKSTDPRVVRVIFTLIWRVLYLCYSQGPKVFKGGERRCESRGAKDCLCFRYSLG